MRRGEIWIGAGHGAYRSKPRPLLIVQSNATDHFSSVILCPITSQDEEAKVLRLPLEPGALNGLKHRSWIMVEKIGALPRDKLANRIGSLSLDEMDHVSAALTELLGLAR